MNEHVAAGNAHYLAGELESAVAAYQQALADDPADAAANGNVAAALHLLGRNDEALVHSRRALERDPNLVAARITGAFIEGAIAGYDVALERIDDLARTMPEDAAILAARAYVLLNLERFDEALRAAQRGIALAPTDGRLFTSIGNALRGLGRFDEAFAAFDCALALGYDPASTLVQKANGQLEFGAFDDARDSFRAALDRMPDLSAAWAGLAEIESFAPGDPLLVEMERRLAASPYLQRRDARTTMHFALGKAYRKAGETERAFAHFAAGNALKRMTFSYDVGDDERLMAETIAYFSAERLERLAGGGDPSQAPIFVVGMPRSGTTLIEQLLATHPDVYGAGERMFFDKAVSTLGFSDMTAVGRSYIAQIAEIAPLGRRVVDKLPSNFRHLGSIHAALPRARIIHIRRDPLDTCLSCYVTLFTGRQDFAYDLTELGRYYRAYETLTAHWRSVLPSDTLLELRYEDVVDDLESNARRILAFCGLPWNDAVLRFHETARPVRTASFHQVRKPIYRSSVGSAAAFRDHLGPLIAALSG
jgi:tetratricopeptide (TPR) repeat protein